MGLMHGGRAVGAVMLGDRPVKAMMLGGEQVWPTGETSYHATIADRWADGLDDGWDPVATGTWSAAKEGAALVVAGDVLFRRVSLQPPDFDARLRFPSTSLTTGNSRFVWRWDGSPMSSGTAYQLRWNNGIPGQGIHLSRYTGGAETVLATAPTSPAFNTWVRVRCESSRHTVKWWSATASEPETWQLDVMDAGGHGSGHIGFGVVPAGIRTASMWSEMHIETI